MSKIDDVISKFHTSKLLMLAVESRIVWDNPSSKIKKEIISDGIKVHSTLISALEEHKDEIDENDLIEFGDNSTAGEFENMIVKLCEKYIDEDATKKLFAAMSIAELIIRNVHNLN